MDLKTISLAACLFLLPVAGSTESPILPYGVPKEGPDIPPSKAMERACTDYSSPTTWGNELFTKFRHTELDGLKYNGGDGTLSRRDPSKVIKANGKVTVQGYSDRRLRSTIPISNKTGSFRYLPWAWSQAV